MLISSENTRREISTFAVFFIQSLVTNLSFFSVSGTCPTCSKAFTTALQLTAEHIMEGWQSG